MKIFNLYFLKEENEYVVRMFEPYYVNKYKNKCKLIYKSKIYPFQEEFKTSDKNSELLKIKLIIYDDFSDINDIIEECESLYSFFECKKSKKNSIKYNQIIKCSFKEMTKMVYIIDDEEDEKIKIFGEDFVQNNKNKCILIYKNKLYPFQENFYIKDIEERDTKLKLFLVEIEDIPDKSNMFNFCTMLEEFALLEDYEKKQLEKIVIKDEYDIDIENTNKIKEFYGNEVYTNIYEEKKESSGKNSIISGY